MEEFDSTITDLIFKHLTGTQTADEQASLDSWLAIDDRRKALLASFRNDEEWTRREQLLRNIDIPKAIRRFEARTGRNHRPGLRRLMRYAAVLVPLMAVGLYMALRDRGIPDYIVPATSNALLYVGGEPIVLGEGTGNTIVIGPSQHARIDSEVIVYDSREGEDAAINRLTTPRGCEFSVRLSDGTLVWLNAGTELEYTSSFGGERREVKLSGEAFFDVQKDGRPFVVTMSGGTSIEVTGTSFLASCYPGQSIRATLETGGIEFVTPGNRTTVVPGRRADYDAATGEVDVHEVDTRCFEAWRNGNFYFDDTPLSEIALTLGRWYDIEFEFADPSLEEMCFSGVTARTRSLDYVLGLLEQTRYVKFSPAGRRTVRVQKAQ